jgi:hypothetical protein
MRKVQSERDKSQDLKQGTGESVWLLRRSVRDNLSSNPTGLG